MANPPPPSSAPKSLILLALIVVTGLTILIIWLSVRPKGLVYTIEGGLIHNFSLTDNNHLNATFDLVLRSYNPNRKVSIYYDKVKVFVSYNDETVAFNTVNSFFQPHRNVTPMGLELVARDVALLEAVARELRLEKSAGKVKLDVRMEAKIRFRVGEWKSGHYTLRVLCSPTVVHFSESMEIERTYCDKGQTYRLAKRGHGNPQSLNSTN